MTRGKVEFDLRPERRRREFVTVRTQGGEVEVPTVPSMTRAMARELRGRVEEKGLVGSAVAEEYLRMFLGDEQVDGLTNGEFEELIGLVMPRDREQLGESSPSPRS